MLATVRDACQIHPIVHDYRMTEAIENLSDLITDQGDGRAFFDRNYITQGMADLFREGLLRLSGKSDQATFELAQAMGGGKTHMMTALGLLAKHPHLRAEVLPAELAERLDCGPARIAAFNGRNDIDNGLSFGEGDYAAEAQIEKLLASARCDNKLALDMQDELPTYWSMAETFLWPASDRRVPWRDLVMRAKTDPTWPWLPGARGLELLRDEALKQGRWRQHPDGQLEKGPFPAEKTSVNVITLSTNRETGETSLSLTPRNAGESPRVYVLKTSSVSEQDEQVEDLEEYRTTEAALYFIAVDSSGKYQTGEPTRWTAELTIRHELHQVADGRKLELRCTPAAEMHYSLDGTNPKEGSLYREPFAVPAAATTLLVAAKAGEVEKTTKISIPADGDDRLIIDDAKPARISDSKRIAIDNTDKVFELINTFNDRADIRLRGVIIVIGEGEHGVQIRFNERELTPTAIETAIRGVREAIGDEQATVQVTIRGGIDFGDGYALKRFAELVGIGLAAGDVDQE